jgi:two-component system, chemotaxis family, response regulator Rcp1
MIEDNPGDARLTREALKEGSHQARLSVVSDGDAGLDFLHRRGAHAGAPRPDLILLDLNLPGKSGREVLAEIKADEDLRRIPVVVLTSSQADKDVQDSYDLHANCYVRKPADLTQFLLVMHSIEDFWLTVVKLPGRG